MVDRVLPIVDGTFETGVQLIARAPLGTIQVSFAPYHLSQLQPDDPLEMTIAIRTEPLHFRVLSGLAVTRPECSGWGLNRSQTARQVNLKPVSDLHMRINSVRFGWVGLYSG